MAKITKITAKDPNKPQEKPAKKPKTEPETIQKPAKSVEKAKKAEKTKKPKKEAQEKATKSKKKVFILFRPFCALGRYLRDSWKEIRQVRWPSRKATWKMVFAVIIYSALFLTIILLLDTLFTFLFNLILA